MYEGPIKAVDSAGCEEAPILRQLRWTDLVARLAATRNMRAPAAGSVEDASASFTAFNRERVAEGQQRVNPDVLSHGKFTRVRPSDTANSAASGDREI